MTGQGRGPSMRPTGPWLGLFVLLSLGAACSNGNEGTAVASDGGTTTPPVDNSACTQPGCACKEPGGTATCQIYRKSGKYVECTQGTTTCGPDLTWGACEGAAVYDGGIPDVAWRLDGGRVTDTGVVEDTGEWISPYDATPIAPDGYTDPEGGVP